MFWYKKALVINLVIHELIIFIFIFFKYHSCELVLIIDHDDGDSNDDVI